MSDNPPFGPDQGPGPSGPTVPPAARDAVPPAARDAVPPAARDAEPLPNFGEIFRGLSRYLKPHSWQVALALVLAVTSSFLTFPNIHYIGKIIEQITRVDPTQSDVMPGIQLMLWLLLGIFILQQAVSFARDYTITRLNESILLQVRLDIFRHLTQLSPAYYERRLTGGILARIVRDAGAVNAFIMAVLIAPLVDVLTFLACVAYGLYVSPVLVGVVAALVPLYIISFKLTNGKMMFWAKRSRDEFEGLTGHLIERLAGMQEVQLFNAVDQETKLFRDRLARFRLVNVKSAMWQGFAEASGLLLNAVGPLAVLWVSVVLIREGQLNIGEFMEFYLLLGLLYMPVSRFIMVNSVYRVNVPSLAKVIDFLATRSEVTEKPGATTLTSINGLVEFDGVDFAYRDAPPVFNELSLRVAPGEKIGLVGPSGCGKSTVLKLLVRFIDVQSGTVRLDGIDVREVTLASLRDAIGVVSQVPFLFKVSVRENIGYGRPDATFEEIQQAARAANIHDDIQQFPDAYDTDVGERGVMLSGGQRQRIAIARVLLQDPRVLLLDEATSALDTESERLVQEAIDRLTKEKTCLIVAHRLSTLASCDRIVVLDQGRIVEQGPMSDLLSRDGLFRRLWEMQSSATPSSPANTD